MSHMRCPLALVAAVTLLLPPTVGAQSLTGALIGTVKDEQGAAVVGARVTVSSPALLGGSQTIESNEKGQLRFPVLPPGLYMLEIQHQGFAPHRDPDIAIAVGVTIERAVVLKIGGVEKTVTVEGSGSRLDTREPGLVARFGYEDLTTIPTRRTSMFDAIRAAPGISPTSPSSATNTTVSALGSSVNENTFLIDSTNMTCPCSGLSRAEPGVDFIQEVYVQSVGASAEFGNAQGAVINVVTRRGGDRFAYDASYYWQTAGLTSQPVMAPLFGSSTVQSGFERVKYRDLTTTLGGPIVRQRAWFFSGYQHLRDYDSQPGADPQYPRAYEQDKLFGKVTWKPGERWQFVHSFHGEFWENPGVPTRTMPIEATNRSTGTTPAITFIDLRHTPSSTTSWDFRLGGFRFNDNRPPQGDPSVPSRRDLNSGVVTGAPPSSFWLNIYRTTAKGTIDHYQPGMFGADHQWKFGAQFERGGHHAPALTPTGATYIDRSGQPFQKIVRPPALLGGLSHTTSAFASDAITIGDRWTINAGLRFDHARASSPDLHGFDENGEETDDIIEGLGTLYTWNLFSPRLGVTAKLTSDGRTMLRASYGRFHQGILTAEYETVHPGNAPTTTYQFDQNTGDYTTFVETVDPARDITIDGDTRAPRTDEYSIGIDREIGRSLSVAVAYIKKDGRNFIAWTDAGGIYEQQVRPLPDGQLLPVLQLTNSTSDRHYLLTNPGGLSLKYDGVVIAAEKRRSGGWQAFGSYTWSKAIGLHAASIATAAGGQFSSIIPPSGVATFARDPNQYTYAYGRLPNDRPHIFRLMGSVDVPRTRVLVAANFQHFTGKPWNASTQVPLKQGNVRILIEPRGSRRLSSQALLDLRVSRPISTRWGRFDLLLDVLNLLNDDAEEGISTDNKFAGNTLNPSFGLPTVFMDPRRAMIGVRFTTGR